MGVGSSVWIGTFSQRRSLNFRSPVGLEDRWVGGVSVSGFVRVATGTNGTRFNGESGNGGVVDPSRHLSSLSKTLGHDGRYAHGKDEGIGNGGARG